MWDEVGIVVQLPVPVYGEPQVVAELGEEAAGEEGGGAAVDACFGLWGWGERVDEAVG